MKLKFSITLLLLCFTLYSWGQDTTNSPSGAAIGKLFFNYHLDNTKGAEQKGAFEMLRSYLGYKYSFNDKFTATVLFDAGKSAGGSDYTVFVKNAKLEYKAESWLTLTAGMFGLKQFDEQEKFWGYRYIYKSFDDEYNFGSSADLGVTAAFKISNKLKADVLIVNGEGFKKIQDPTGNNRYGADLVYTPTDTWVFKAYYDAKKGIDVDDITKETTVTNIALFVGYKLTDKFRIGAEYNLMQNGITYKEASKGKDLQGLSFYSTYNINEKWNVFGRYDNLSSNKLAGEKENWNFSQDGNTIIAGLEYRVTKGVNTALNYRYTKFEDASNTNTSLIYLNLEFSF